MYSLKIKKYRINQCRFSNKIALCVGLYFLLFVSGCSRTPYRIFLSEGEILETIMNEFISNDVEIDLVDNNSQLKVSVLPGGDPNKVLFNYDARLAFFIESDILVAFVETTQFARSIENIDSQIHSRELLTYWIKEEFLQQHGVEVDWVFYSLGRTTDSNEGHVLLGQSIIYDLKSQVHNFIEEVGFVIVRNGK